MAADRILLHRINNQGEPVPLSLPSHDIAFTVPEADQRGNAIVMWYNHAFFVKESVAEIRKMLGLAE